MKRKASQKFDIDFEIRFYEGILEKRSGFLQAMMALADLYTKKGLHLKGLEIDEKLSCLRPGDPVILYNLSCSYSLVNDIDRAFAVMKKAVQCGYNDFRYLEQDKHLEKLLQTSRFRQYLFLLKKKKTERTGKGPA